MDRRNFLARAIAVACFVAAPSVSQAETTSERERLFEALKTAKT